MCCDPWLIQAMKTLFPVRKLDKNSQEHDSEARSSRVCFFCAHLESIVVPAR